MVAVGYTSEGEIKEFRCINGILSCWGEDLVSLEVPVGVKYVRCEDNKLTELIIPNGVKEVSCHNNQITELIIPESIVYLYCDKEIKGLEEFTGNIEIVLW